MNRYFNAVLGNLRETINHEQELQNRLQTVTNLRSSITEYVEIEAATLAPADAKELRGALREIINPAKAKPWVTKLETKKAAKKKGRNTGFGKSIFTLRVLADKGGKKGMTSTEIIKAIRESPEAQAYGKVDTVYAALNSFVHNGTARKVGNRYKITAKGLLKINPNNSEPPTPDAPKARAAKVG
jgi:hypothetical protein